MMEVQVYEGEGIPPSPSVKFGKTRKKYILIKYCIKKLYLMLVVFLLFYQLLVLRLCFIYFIIMIIIMFMKE